MELKEVFADVTIGEQLSHGGLHVFPLLRAEQREPRYVLLDDLMEQGLADVTEVGEAGAVPILEVLNRGEADALLLDGTELRGAKQNRMVNITIIVGAHTKTEIPVTCVEAGRWAYKSRRFESSRRTVASKLRWRKAQTVSEALLRRNVARADQADVWNEVGGYLHRSDVNSPTAAMDDAFERRSTEIDDIIAPLRDLDANGAIVVINGEIIALDLLDSRKTFRKLWPGLLRGYAMDAVLEAGKVEKGVSEKQVRDWLSKVLSASRIVPREVAGVGRFGAVEADEAVGSIVEHAQDVVHLALFPRS